MKYRLHFCAALVSALLAMQCLSLQCSRSNAEDETRAMFRKPEYQKIVAVRAGRVYAIPGKHITTTSHNIVKAVEDVQTLLSQSR